MESAGNQQTTAEWPDLASMSREELLELDRRIDTELDSRAFEERLRREVEYHMRKSQRERRQRR